MHLYYVLDNTALYTHPPPVGGQAFFHLNNTRHPELVSVSLNLNHILLNPNSEDGSSKIDSLDKMDLFK